MKTRRSWSEKLEHPNGGRVVPIPPAMAKRMGEGTILIPKGLDVDAAIRRVKKGQLVTQSQIRDHLARAAGADQTCPITTGILVRIAAEAAAEEERAGKQQVTPFWRVIRDDGSLIEKLPGGAAGQADRLAEEGQRITRGRKIRVADFESHLVRL
jgi:alkylated DNA nucleotide flippase Atl1